jgi:hypothetical protein
MMEPRGASTWGRNIILVRTPKTLLYGSSQKVYSPQVDAPNLKISCQLSSLKCTLKTRSKAAFISVNLSLIYEN